MKNEFTAMVSLKLPRQVFNFVCVHQFPNSEIISMELLESGKKWVWDYPDGGNVSLTKQGCSHAFDIGGPKLPKSF